MLLFKIQEIISALKFDTLRIQERLDDLVNSPKGWKRWVPENFRTGLVLEGKKLQHNSGAKAKKLLLNKRQNGLSHGYRSGEIKCQHLFGFKVVNRADPP